LPPTVGPFDAILQMFISAAREAGEILTARSLSKRQFVLVLDSMPYYTDTIQSQLAYPPSYYSLPRYSTTLWNYSQMIKLPYSPAISIDQFQYIDNFGNPQQLVQDVDFILDRTSEPSRIFPMTGQFWPANLYVPNACEIIFTAGYDPNATMASPPNTYNVLASPPNQQPSSTITLYPPNMILLGIMNLVTFWFNNRGNPGLTNPTLLDRIEQMFLQQAIVDFQPTRG
jgi:hypothetical protein